MGPLDGIKILDLTSMVSGPLAATILGDQGADVPEVGLPVLHAVLHPLRDAGKGGEVHASVQTLLDHRREAHTSPATTGSGPGLEPGTGPATGVLRQSLQQGVLRARGQPGRSRGPGPLDQTSSPPITTCWTGLRPSS